MAILENVSIFDRQKIIQQRQKSISYKKEMKRPEDINNFYLTMITDPVEKKKRKEVLDKILEIRRTFGELSTKQIVDNLLKFTKEKIMFGVPCGLVYGHGSDKKIMKKMKEDSLIDCLIKQLSLINQQQDFDSDMRKKLKLLQKEICDKIIIGTPISVSVLAYYGDDFILQIKTELGVDVVEERSKYLSSLEKIVHESIESNDKESVIVQRDNEFYCVKCPEDSIVTPAKFMNAQEFKDLEYGALQIGEEQNIIRLLNGKYHDMKGRVKMTFEINGETLEMTLSSEKADECERNSMYFGCIVVSMDDKNCELFLKHKEELSKEPRIGKIVWCADNFVKQKKKQPTDPPTWFEKVTVATCDQGGQTEVWPPRSQSVGF